MALEGVLERLGLVSGRLEPSWTSLGSLLGRLLVDLTVSDERLGGSWGGPGRVLGCLGASWGRLGASWRSLGADFPSKRELN